MARRSVTEPSVRELIARLVPLYLRAGSVQALTQLLAEAGGTPVHPNRLHGLLGEDDRRGLHDASVRAVAAAVDAVVDPDPDSDRTARFADHLRASVVPLAGRELSEVARVVGCPPAVARHLLEEAGLTTPASSLCATPPPVRPAQGWGYQTDAVAAARRSLARGPARKVGVIVPTGGGKTRIGNRIALEELAAAPDGERVAWLTHRTELRRQAHADLQRLLTEGGTVLPAGAAELWGRIDFVMLGELSAYLAAGRPLLVIVDEAHHAPAPSYAPLFAPAVGVRAVFLTATPNRPDALPLGVDEIAYAITYRELADRGVVLRPRFEPFPVPNFDWGPDDLRRLAEEVIRRADDDYTKVLVIAPTVDKVRAFYQAVRDAWDAWPGHVLDADDLGFVAASGNSHHLETGEFLTLFRGKPRGVLVSAHMLLEGFDDPAINAVVVTYPSSSVIRLMQAAGRCVRYAPGKSTAFVVQARNPALGYYYDEGWLYQDISDALRPALRQVEYSNPGELAERVEEALADHRVAEHVRAAARRRLADTPPGGEFRLLLSGLPYFGPVDPFDQWAEWSAVPVPPPEYPRLLAVFNGYCHAGADLPDPREFLAKHVTRDEYPAGDWRLYYTLLGLTQ